MESSRFGSSGNLSQTSSQLSETGQESTGGSELEESFHSYHSTGFHPSANGQPRTNGHLPTNGHSTVGEQEIHTMPDEVGRGLKNDTPAERGSSKLQRYSFCSEFNSFCMCYKEDVWELRDCLHLFLSLYLHIHVTQVPWWWAAITLFPIQSSLVEGHQ